MTGRRSQVTLFITAGVVILVLVGILFYSGMSRREAEKQPIIAETLEFPAELKPLGMFVQACLQQEALKTINITALQGGRPLAPRHPYEWNNMTLSHGYYYGLNEIPALEEMQDEMAGHLKIHLNDCLNNLQDFRNKGMNLIVGEISPKFEVGPDAAAVSLDYPITLKKDTGEISVEKFATTIPSRLGYLHEAARRIVEEDVKGGASFLFMSQFDMDINIFLTNTSSLVFYFQTKEKELIFKFVNTYQQPEITVQENSGAEEEIIFNSEDEEVEV